MDLVEDFTTTSPFSHFLYLNHSVICDKFYIGDATFYLEIVAFKKNEKIQYQAMIYSYDLFSRDWRERLMFDFQIVEAGTDDDVHVSGTFNVFGWQEMMEKDPSLPNEPAIWMVFNKTPDDAEELDDFPETLQCNFKVQVKENSPN